jgi:hypothetical protein
MNWYFYCSFSFFYVKVSKIVSPNCLNLKSFTSADPVSKNVSVLYFGKRKKKKKIVIDPEIVAFEV